MMAGGVDEEFAKVINSYRKVEADIQQCISQMTDLDARRNENTMVKEEFEALAEGESIFKLSGPLLVRQPVEEGKSDVSRRLDLIERQIKQMQDSIEAKKSEKDKIGERVVEMQKARAGKAAAAARGK